MLDGLPVCSGCTLDVVRTQPWRTFLPPKQGKMAKEFRTNFAQNPYLQRAASAGGGAERGGEKESR